MKSGSRRWIPGRPLNLNLTAAITGLAVSTADLAAAAAPALDASLPADTSVEPGSYTSKACRRAGAVGWAHVREIRVMRQLFRM